MKVRDFCYSGSMETQRVPDHVEFCLYTLPSLALSGNLTIDSLPNLSFHDQDVPTRFDRLARMLIIDSFEAWTISLGTPSV